MQEICEIIQKFYLFEILIEENATKSVIYHYTESGLNHDLAVDMLSLGAQAGDVGLILACVLLK